MLLLYTEHSTLVNIFKMYVCKDCPHWCCEVTVFKHIFYIVGQLEKAAEHYEAFYHLTAGQLWKDETGRTHNSLACENLWRIYTLLSDKMLENREWQQAIKTLIKALDMAREGRWKITPSYFLFFYVLLIFCP